MLEKKQRIENSCFFGRRKDADKLKVFDELKPQAWTLEVAEGWKGKYFIYILCFLIPLHYYEY